MPYESHISCLALVGLCSPLTPFPHLSISAFSSRSSASPSPLRGLLVAPLQHPLVSTYHLPSAIAATGRVLVPNLFPPFRLWLPLFLSPPFVFAVYEVFTFHSSLSFLLLPFQSTPAPRVACFFISILAISIGPVVDARFGLIAPIATGSLGEFAVVLSVLLAWRSLASPKEPCPPRPPTLSSIFSTAIFLPHPLSSSSCTSSTRNAARHFALPVSSLPASSSSLNLSTSDFQPTISDQRPDVLVRPFRALCRELITGPVLCYRLPIPHEATDILACTTIALPEPPFPISPTHPLRHHTSRSPSSSTLPAAVSRHPAEPIPLFFLFSTPQHHSTTVLHHQRAAENGCVHVHCPQYDPNRYRADKEGRDCSAGLISLQFHVGHLPGLALSLAVPLPPGRPHIARLPPSARYYSAGLEPGIVVSHVNFDCTSQGKSEAPRKRKGGGKDKTKQMRDRTEPAYDFTLCSVFYTAASLLMLCPFCLYPGLSSCSVPRAASAVFPSA